MPVIPPTLHPKQKAVLYPITAALNNNKSDCSTTKIRRCLGWDRTIDYSKNSSGEVGMVNSSQGEFGKLGGFLGRTLWEGHVLPVRGMLEGHNYL